MSERLLKALHASNALKAANPADLEASLPAWKARRLEPGEVLWTRGRPADEVAIVHKGTLEVELEGEVLGTVHAGEPLGEAGAFLPGSQRSATVRAKERSLLLVMGTLRLRELKRADSSVYRVLLRQAATSSVRRVRRASAWVAQVAQSDAEAPSRKELSALVRMWRSVRPGLPPDPAPPLAPLLRAQPGLADAPPEALLALTTVFEARAVPEGEVLMLEGDTGERLDAMYLLAAGTVDVLRHVRGGAKRLTTLRPGGQFGCNALIEPGPRTASCVASSPAWLYKLDKKDFLRPPKAAEVWWWESILRNVAAQQAHCDGLLAEALGLGQADEPEAPQEPAKARPKKAKKARQDTFRSLLDDAGFGMGDFSESELDRVEVVYDEAQLRRRDKQSP